MAADEGGRTTTAFQSIAYATGAEPPEYMMSRLTRSTVDG